MRYCLILLCLSLISCSSDPTKIEDAGSDYKNTFVYTNENGQKIVCVNDLKQWCAKNTSAQIISICTNAYKSTDSCKIAISWIIVYKDNVPSFEVPTTTK